MSETTCRWDGSGNPRVLGGRHGDECPGGECRGCLPCTEAHCRVCGMAHAVGACASCLNETREALRDIARMCSTLPTEVRHRGVDSEAMNLLGPTADPEARGNVEASYLVGRLPEGWLEANHGKTCPLLSNEACVGCAGDERHPLMVLASWQDVYAAEFEHEITRRATVADAAGYIDRNLTYAAEWPHVPFEDLARDLRACRSHLEDVLHDGEQVETGAPCWSCDRPLTHVWGERVVDDRWICDNKRCKEKDFTTAQYRGWVEEDARNAADRLTAADMAIRFSDEVTELKASQVRVWGARTDKDGAPLVRKRGRNEQGMTLYDVSDVEARLTRGGESAANGDEVA